MVNWKTPRRRKQARQFSTIEALESRVLLSATCDNPEIVEAESTESTGDGVVDADDYLLWQQDESADGNVDSDDLAHWEANYGAVVESDSSSPTSYLYDAIGNLVATVDESESLNTDIDTDIENLTTDSEPEAKPFRDMETVSMMFEEIKFE